MHSVTRMIGREIGHAKLNFALSAGAVVIAVALCITIAQLTVNLSAIRRLTTKHVPNAKSLELVIDGTYAAPNALPR